MAINQNTAHVNEFVGGMNSDISYDKLQQNQYVFGQNVRISNNDLYEDSENPYSKEGNLCPIPFGIPMDTEIDKNVDSILATASIGNIGAVIVKYKNQRWGVYRIENDNMFTVKNIFKSKGLVKHEGKFSVVINKEINNIIKLYIADGVHPIMSINITQDFDEYNAGLNSEEDLISDWYFPINKIQVISTITGNLKAGYVQYTYRLYKKHGVKSKIAPLTNKITVIENYRNKEQGNAKNTNTNIGFRLGITIEPAFSRIFDKIQIYRLHYSDLDKDSVVNLIYDGDIYDSQNKHSFTFNDNGSQFVQQLSVSEFAALDGLVIIPNAIEQNQNYMFASNIEDQTVLKLDPESFDSKSYSARVDGVVELYNENDTTFSRAAYVFNINKTDLDFDTIPAQYVINKYSDVNQNVGLTERCSFDNNQYVGGVGKNVSWRLISVPFTIADCNINKKGNIQYIKYKGDKLEYESSDYSSDIVFQQSGLPTPSELSYNDLYVNTALKSLMRDSVYRYGIILYDKNGKHTDVQWIADIKTPNLQELPATTCVDAIQNNATGKVHVQWNYGAWGVGDGGITQEDSKIYCGIGDSIQSPYYTIKKGQNITFVQNNSNCDLQFHVWCTIGNPGWDWHDKLETFYEGTFGDRNLTFSDAAESLRQQLMKTNWYKLIQVYQPYENSELHICGKTLHPGESYTAEYDDSQVYITYEVSLVIDFYEDDPWWHDDGQGGFPGYQQFTGIIQFFSTPSFQIIEAASIIKQDEKSIIAHPLGIQFNVHSLPDNIVGYQIVRCNRDSKYSKNLLQCVIARPIRQQLPGGEGAYSPFYPNNILTTQPYSVYCHNWNKDTYGYGAPYTNMGSVTERNIYQIYAPEISLRRNTTLGITNELNTKIQFLTYFYTKEYHFSEWTHAWDNMLRFARDNMFYGLSNKQGSVYQYTYKWPVYGKGDTLEIEALSDTTNPQWYHGFGNHVLSGGKISAATKSYKSFVNIVKDKTYVNWHCNGMYDLKSCYGDSDLGQSQKDAYALIGAGESRPPTAKGLVGPGPVCFIISTKDKPGSSVYNYVYTAGYDATTPLIGTFVGNIQHTALQYAGHSSSDKKFDVYFGFGNFAKAQSGNLNVFDGDTYIQMFEIVQLFKAYDFNSTDTLESSQIVFYVPIESSINTLFNYGMNYKNTHSPNLMLDPGEITGIYTQERPLNQYNSVFSQNNVSNDIYTESSDNTVDIIPHRICYSDLKTTGESIDSWLHYLPLNYIDADSRYGEITELNTSKDILYCWQEGSFGKLSVKERSLVVDQNNNSVQLGQGGILQRIDYINTHSGIGKHHHSSLNTDDGVYWIDYTNKIISAYNGQTVINLSEKCNVQNVVNNRFANRIPTIEYDLQNNELLCNCIDNNSQLIFNTKLNVASSIYTRKYLDTININNTVFGITDEFKFEQYNNINVFNSIDYMPTKFIFVVNPNPSITKVFDNQQIVLSSDCDNIEQFQENTKFVFKTNSQSTDTLNIDMDYREDNIRYAVPREHDVDYGSRMRGKWMSVQIENIDPTYKDSISHIITKYRQSFS